jgi:NADPH:quinone reductase
MNRQEVNRQVILTSYPQGMPSLSNFKTKECAIPQLKEGELLIKSLYLSVDPYMRGRMTGRPSYIPPFQVDQPLTGDVIGKIVQSKNAAFKAGEIVFGSLDWADYTISNGINLQILNSNEAPITAALGALGMPGMTAYFGMLDIGSPKSGETVVVSGAAGIVGMLAGQIAKLKGCRVIGIAGSDAKVDYLSKELGFDAAINYKNPDYTEELKKACPKGVDVYFDNVGGAITDEVMKLINWHARIVVCGQISMYNLEAPDVGPRNFRILIVKSALAKGFIVRLDYNERFPEGIAQMSQWIKQNKIKYKESIAEGLEKAPEAFIGLFKGDNLGKQIVKISE